MTRPIKAAEPITAWLPEQDRHRLAVLGKLCEESGEVASRAARCITHGLDERDPDTGRLNRDELAREVSDLSACLELLREMLSVVPIDTRTSSKANGFRRWHALIDQEQANGS